ncbi:MAG: tyrosine-type recombinase/integrase [bacterium]|nr:tyrosine-type recombinase/integrase [bacterium]
MFTSAKQSYDEIHNEYLRWLSEVRESAIGTVKIRSRYLRKFLDWYDKFSCHGNLSELQPDEIESFFIKATGRWGGSYRRSLQATLKSFFDFCYEREYTSQNLRHSLPLFKTYRLADIPKKIEDEEVFKLLESIDRTTDSGKRTYAVISILYAYGVRGCQIAGLKLSDISWSGEEIRFPPAKGGKSSSFPLTAEVGNALLDYLQNVRRSTHYPEVFLTLRAPYVPLLGNSSISQIIRTAMISADIDSPGKGACCFRHGFVSRLLKQNESFKNIADLVGHKHIQTTFIYTKIDLNSLAEAALELPEVKNETH